MLFEDETALKRTEQTHSTDSCIMNTKYFKQSAIYATHLAADQGSGIAVVTGGRSGIGQAIATKIATFPFIDTVLSV